MDEIVIIVVIVAGAAALFAYLQERVGRVLKSLGEEYGLDYQGESFGTGSLRGEVRGHAVEIEIESRGQSDTRTVYRGDLGGLLPVSVSLAPEGVLSSLGDMVGAQDVQVGDEAFDEAFVVKAKDPSRAREHFGGNEASDALVSLEERSSHVRLENGTLEMHQRGVPNFSDERFHKDFEAFLGGLDALRDEFEEAEGETGGAADESEESSSVDDAASSW